MECLNFKEKKSKKNDLLKVMIIIFIFVSLIAIFAFEKGELLGKALAH